MKLFLLCSIILSLVSCTPKNEELYVLTESFIQSIDSGINYGMFDGPKHAQLTSDGKYQVMPIGRLINVKIMEVVEKEVYQNLKMELEEHYNGDYRVKDIYISNGGTIMIDCRRL